MKVIARIRSDFDQKFGIPRQSGLVPELSAEVVFEPEFANPDAVRGIEEFSHIWLIWNFSESDLSDWMPTVRPPRLHGERRGVFATRSPMRPNPIGISSVKLENVRFDPVEGPILTVSGADLLNGTPIFDIKPYVSTDCHPSADFGFTSREADYRLTVDFPEELLALIPENKRKALLGVLSEDPRPHYHHDAERIYGVAFAGFDVRFKVSGDELTIIEICDFNP